MTTSICNCFYVDLTTQKTFIVVKTGVVKFIFFTKIYVITRSKLNTKFLFWHYGHVIPPVYKNIILHALIHGQ